MTHVIAAAPQYTLANTCKSMMRVQFALIPERETCELCMCLSGPEAERL